MWVFIDIRSLDKLTTHQTDLLCTNGGKSYFHAMTEFINKPSILAFPDVDKIAFFNTDSKYTLVDLLMEDNDKYEMISVQYASQTFMKSERVHNTFKKEVAAVIFRLTKFRHHNFREFFVVFSDHKALQAVYMKADIHDRPTRWLDIITE